MIRNTLIGLSMLAFAACGGNSLVQSVSYSCVGMTGAVKVLTVARAQGKLSQANIDKVDSAIDIVDPYCGAANPPTMDTVTLTAFNQARQLLLSKLDEVNK